MFLVIPYNNVFAGELNAGDYGALFSNTIGGAVAILLSWIALIITSVLGLITTLLVQILVNVSKFNNIINVPAVNIGWTTIRDICNMFFILILLVIAFGTILRIESYNAKRLLPKLLIMAVLINFSKTIFGLIIDFAQIFMLTFANSINESGGWFMDLFNIKGLYQGQIGTNLNLSTSSTGFESWGVAMAVIAGIFASIITLIVVAVILAVLVIRIIMLWIYTILSPLVFLGMALPSLQKYTSRIWDDFIKQVMVGPVLIFFLWLALTTAQTSSDALSSTTLTSGSQFCSFSGISSLFCTPQLQTYLIFIGFLIGGLSVAQSMGGAAGSIAGKGLGKVAKIGAVGLAGAKIGGDWLNRKTAGKAGIDLNPYRFAAKVKTGLAERKREELLSIDQRATRNLKKGGIRGGLAGITAHDWTENYFGLRGVGKAFRGRAGQMRKRQRNIDTKGNEIKTINNNLQEDNNKLSLLRNKKGSEDKLKKIDEEMTLLEKGGIVLGSPQSARIQELNVNKAKIKKEIEEASNIPEDEIELEARIKENTGKKSGLNKEVEDLKKVQYKNQIVDWKGRQVDRVAQAEETKNIETEDETELISLFEQALAKGRANLAAGLAKKIAKSGGFNTMLSKFGYQSSVGFNAKEKADYVREHGQESYNKDRGFMDFMRDTFVQKLGMNEQSMLALENDLGGIGEANSHAYLRKTVGIENGKFIQNDRNVAMANENSETAKLESENEVRKKNRLEYGAEDLYTGKFKWSDNGLIKFISRLDIIAKEIGGNRFNNNAAAKITMSEDAMDKLGSTLEDLFRKGVIRPSEKVASAEDFMNKLRGYGQSKQVINDEKKYKIIEQHIRERNT